jgi:hypothetical protein
VSAPVAIGGRVPLAAALADELVRASTMLADLAYDLGSDEVTLRRHLSSLQQIDRVTQMQLAIADLLRGHAEGEGDEALAAVTLEDMGQRLRLALGN